MNFRKYKNPALIGICTFLFVAAGVSWWWLPVLLILPEISLLAYVFGVRVAGRIYDIFHHSTLGFGLLIIGHFTGNIYLYMIGLGVLLNYYLQATMGWKTSQWLPGVQSMG